MLYMCRLAGICSKGQPVADAAGVLQLQLHSFSAASFPAAPQTPQRPEPAQNDTAAAAAASNGTGTAAKHAPAKDAPAAAPASSAAAALGHACGYEQLSVVAVLADGVPVPAADGSQDTTLVSSIKRIPSTE
jgi:hypothetical protein